MFQPEWAVLQSAGVHTAGWFTDQRALHKTQPGRLDGSHLLHQLLNWHVAILNLPVFRRCKLDLGSVKNILSIFPPYERNKQSWHQRAVTNEIGYLQGWKQDMLEML